MYTPKDELVASEKFLKKLIKTKEIVKEKLVMDGTAIVIQITHEKIICDLVIEVRMPGWTNFPDMKPNMQGRLLVHLDNVSDESVPIRHPQFILTGGLRLPWKVGLQMMLHSKPNAIGEALCWQVPLTGEDDLNLLGSEIVLILQKCRMIISRKLK